MRFMASLVLCLSLACTPLEERVPIVVGEWCASDRTAEVSCVIDGDTLDVDGCTDTDAEGERIRLLGVAAPEIDHGDGGGECYGDEAKSFLDWVLTGRRVTLQFDVECTDIYERTLAWIVLDVDLDDELAPFFLEMDEFDEDNEDEILEEDKIEVLVNGLMVRLGYADVYEGDLSNDVRYGQRLEEAAEDAEADQLGLHDPDACVEDD